MFRRHGHRIWQVFLLTDLVITTSVWLGAYWLRFTLWPAEGEFPPISVVAASLPVVLVLATLAYRLCGLYEVHRLRRLSQELGVVCQASALLFLLTITAAFYRRDLYESRLALALFLGMNAVGLAIGRRMLWRAIQIMRHNGYHNGRALIVGAGRTGRLVLQTIRDNHWNGLEPVGFVDQAPKVEPVMLPRLGTIPELPLLIARHKIDHVFLALPFNRYGELREIYSILAEQMVEVQLVPDLPNLTGMRIRSVEVDEVSFLSLRGNPHYGWGRLAKRGMDIVISSIALLLLTPVFVTLCLAIKSTSRGPVLFRQPRAGLAGKQFEMLKFRSMRIDAEHKSGPVWARRNDQRCTPLGAFIRRWSLDELPQLLNVLKGDMSLVGPRPERDVFIEKFRVQFPNYQQRHTVKAGITGWAQVNGWRGNTSTRRRLECDLWYISNWSLWLDFKILCMTLWCGFRHRNAY